MENYLEKVYLWLGQTDKSQDQITSYFKLDFSTEGDFENPNYKICGFCLDIGEKWYDEDFIGYIKFEEELSLKEILNEVPIKQSEHEKIIEKCEKMALKDINAVYWYSGDIKKPSSKKHYNDLQYIGLYDL